MADSPRRRYASPSPRRYRSRSRSRSPTREYGERPEANNPGNNLYVTGLSTRVTEKDLEDHFAAEGKVMECRLVVDPRTRESRGFGFVTMDSLEDAERCIKYLNRSILEGRVITVEKAKRKRARTPTPGKYLGVRSAREISASLHDHDRRRGSREVSRGDSYSSRRSPRYSPYRGGRDYSPQHSPYRGGSSGGHRRERSLSPYRSPPRRGYSYRSRSHSRSRSLTPYYR
ncbi:transformer-2 protein [Marchantia polymorpha subsp. ruderalis]|uniref:RRM domain-containing protein n=2 Tax=Marchantia polymorpha TaxID=3197 RepID=A0AAF6B149_MARPO|nr:hypothetical protein MARPO_0004s0118 [Marchantia polymorpha]PTQ48848.1 hypothetical protein MARPO_0004s0118 [Marchantia polymorpha]BBN05732.1 hypothetical protein Mp_3g15540 [Marchantia polymorpha subsp. ruderalis]BBN05733.1 hypothetical protein Mp_3g15540 [Marchantia polymorpha subsp. ruderalis]|eukprot:PTQ48847.1 hypothetical protein MARPO_0004s0118 [Marchantia polymorpha]